MITEYAWLLVALPLLGATLLLLLLFFLAVALCLLLDRRKAKRAAAREAETGLGADNATSAEDLSAMGRTDEKS